MFKKFFVGLLVAMVGVCFADYKSDFNWNLTDLVKIESGLQEATKAKDERYVALYSSVKAIQGKKIVTYTELKSAVQSLNCPVWCKRVCLVYLVREKFIDFSEDMIKDSSINKTYVFVTAITSNKKVLQKIGVAKWRELIVNKDILSHSAFKKNLKLTDNLVTMYKKNAIGFTTSQVKEDALLFKRLWYDNITVSEGWKQLLIKVELILKSVQ